MGWISKGLKCHATHLLLGIQTLQEDSEQESDMAIGFVLCVPKKEERDRELGGNWEMGRVTLWGWQWRAGS